MRVYEEGKDIEGNSKSASGQEMDRMGRKRFSWKVCRTKERVGHKI